MKKIFGLLSLLALLLTSCDDGHVDDPVYTYDAEGYTTEITGTFKNTQTWSEKYSVVVAGFSDESNYSTIQKVLPSDEVESTVTLKNIPSETKTIEIAVVNSLRKRIMTLYSYTIPDNQNADETIKLNVGEMKLGMFDAINQGVFQSGTTTCSKCHQGEDAPGGLDLSSENAYANLVGVTAKKNADMKRVVAGDAENSFLYKVLSDGDDNVHFSHTGFFAGDDMSPVLKLIKEWIDNGAKE